MTRKIIAEQKYISSAGISCTEQLIETEAGVLIHIVSTERHPNDLWRKLTEEATYDNNA